MKLQNKKKKKMPEKIQVAEATTKTIIISGLGGASYYLYNIHRGRKFQISLFIINILLAGFVGYVVGGMLSLDFVIRDSVIALSGFSAFPILDIMEKKFPYILGEYLKVDMKEDLKDKNKKGQI